MYELYEIPLGFIQFIGCGKTGRKEGRGRGEKDGVECKGGKAAEREEGG